MNIQPGRLLHWPRKQVDEALDYTVDFSGSGVTSGRTIALTYDLPDPVDPVIAASISAAPSGSGELVLFNPSFSVTQITFWASGGLALRQYLIRIEATTAAGRTFEWGVGLSIDPLLGVGTSTPPPSEEFGSPVTVTTSPQAGAASEVVTGGIAVIAIAGPSCGGYITNPESATEQLFVDFINAPGTVAPGSHGTTSAIDPGQTWQLPIPIPAGVTVMVNAATSGHTFTVVTWWIPGTLTITPQGGAASVVRTGGVAVIAITGPARGGYITNPESATEQAFVDPVNMPGTVAPGSYGTTSAIDPGQTWRLPMPIPSGVTVMVNAVTSGHALTVVTW